MNESHVLPRTEEAVLDPTLFLIHKENLAYLKGQRNGPLLDPMRSVNQLRANLLFAVTFLWSLLAIVAALIIPSALSIGMSIVALVLFGAALAYTIHIYLKHQTSPKGGVVVAGYVTHADRVWLPGNRFMMGVRYTFTAPGGVQETGQSEGFADQSSDTITPAPGTPVRIYYVEEGKYYLL